MEPTDKGQGQEVANNNMLTKRYKKMSHRDKIDTFRKLKIGKKILLQTNYHTRDNIKVLGEVHNTTSEMYEGQHFVTIQYLKDTILTKNIFEIKDLWTK